jgi:hypothetical protein
MIGQRSHRWRLSGEKSGKPWTAIKICALFAGHASPRRRPVRGRGRHETATARLQTPRIILREHRLTADRRTAGGRQRRLVRGVEAVSARDAQARWAGAINQRRVYLEGA